MPTGGSLLHVAQREAPVTPRRVARAEKTLVKSKTPIVGIGKTMDSRLLSGHNYTLAPVRVKSGSVCEEEDTDMVRNKPRKVAFIELM